MIPPDLACLLHLWQGKERPGLLLGGRCRGTTLSSYSLTSTKMCVFGLACPLEVAGAGMGSPRLVR